MNLASLSLRYRTVVVTLVVGLFVWGCVTFVTMPRREDPEFTIRTCVITTQWSGATTTDVEELITDQLEEALDGIEEVEHLRSTTTPGLSVIYVDLDDVTPPRDIQNVWDKVRAKVDLVEMPAEGIRPKVNDEFGDTSILVLGIYQKPLKNQPPGPTYTTRDLEVFADQIRDSLRLLEGVAKVEKFGVNPEAIYVETDIGNWSQIDLTTDSLRALVESRNIVTPGGIIDTQHGQFTVKPGGNFNAVEEIEAIRVAASTKDGSNNLVSLRDVGLTVRRTARDPRHVICRFSDVHASYPAVMLGVTMKSGANIVDICNRCTARVERMVKTEQALPRDLAVQPVSNQADNVSAKINDVISNVISAIIIVVVVVFLFVGLRTSLVMAANIPVVVLGSVGIISAFGVQLEQISLASIIIALGLLVDNAVQVCDQTRTNCLQGMSPSEAAESGAKTLMFPMLSGTLTTVAAFLPMLFALEGGGAEYVYSLPVTLSTTLLLSWFLAMSFCVILAATFIRAPKNADAPTAPLPWLSKKLAESIRRTSRSKNVDASSSEPSSDTSNFFLRTYRWTAMVALRHKWLAVTLAVAMLVGCLQLPVSSEFFPQDRRDQFYVTVILPETSTIEQTNEIVKQVEATIRRLSSHRLPSGKEVERLRAMRSMTGQGGSRWALGIDPPAPSPSVCEILVRTTAGDLTPKFVDDLRQAFYQGVPDLKVAPIVGARVVPKKLALGPPAAAVELRVTGDGFADIGQLREVANKVKSILRQQPGTWDVADSWGVQGFQLKVDIDEERANLAGVTNVDVADNLQAYFSGLKLSTFRERDHEVPVFFRLKQEQREKLSVIDAAYVEGRAGKLPLNSIAKVTALWHPAKIERRDQNRTIEVTAEVENEISGNDVVLDTMSSEEMKELLEQLPSNMRIEIGGALEESQDSAQQMSTSFAISMMCIVIILVVQYNGWSKTIVILVTLPLALVGAWFGLWLTDNPLGFMPQLGLLSLFGIVLNTGIIFIEFADILIAERVQQRASEGDAEGPICGLTREEFRACLAEAGSQRMLPIFLTTATTVGGLLPLALSGGPLWEGMAWLMIFGLLVATLLTLYVVPALYAIMVETLRVRPIADPRKSTN